MDSTRIVQEFLDAWLKPCHDACNEDSSLGYHVVFERGTILKVEFVCSGKPAEDEGTEWDGSVDKVDFPAHRIGTDTVIDISEQLTHLNKALDEDIQDPTLLRVLKKAIGILIEDGYPYPGGEGSDRVPFPIPLSPSMKDENEDDDEDDKDDKDETKHNTACMVLWPHRHMAILSFVSSDFMKGSVERAVAIAGEARRLDGFMFFPFAVIGPDLTVTSISLPTFDSLQEQSKNKMKH